MRRAGQQVVFPRILVDLPLDHHQSTSRDAAGKGHQTVHPAGSDDGSIWREEGCDAQELNFVQPVCKILLRGVDSANLLRFRRHRYIPRQEFYCRLSDIRQSRLVVPSTKVNSQEGCCKFYYGRAGINAHRHETTSAAPTTYGDTYQAPAQISAPQIPNSSFAFILVQAHSGVVARAVRSPDQLSCSVRGLSSCVLFTSENSRERGRSNARLCRALHVCAAVISVERGRAYTPTNLPRSLPPPPDAACAPQLTNYPANASHPRVRSLHSSSNAPNANRRAA